MKREEIVVEQERRLIEFQVSLLKGPLMYLLTDGLTYSELKHTGISSKGTGDIWRGTELSVSL